MSEYGSTIRILLQVIAHGHHLDSSFHEGDSPLAKQICYGVLRNYYQLNALVSMLLNKPLARKHLDLKILLLAGIYSVMDLNRPAHSSVNAAVEATIALRKPWAKKLINGVLRGFIRNQTDMLAKTKQDPECINNHPRWLLDRIASAYPDQMSEIIEANNTRPPMTLRVNLSRISRPNYADLLDKLDIKSSPGKLAPGALYLEEPVPVNRLPGFEEGQVSVQDEASQLAASLLNLTNGIRVLDACAAPGGKTCHILETEFDISLTAIDKDASRLLKVRQNLDRLKYQCEVIHKDLMIYQTDSRFDRILLDVPCSATGIIRRHPDIKLLRTDADIDKLATTQLELLEKAWSLLKENGELVYSTCSILPTENEQVLSCFSQQDESVVFVPIEASWGMPAEMGRQILPGIRSADGFFYATLKKQSP